MMTILYLLLGMEESNTSDPTLAETDSYTYQRGGDLFGLAVKT